MRPIISVQIDLTPRQVAEVFADFDDEQQAQVIIEVAAIAEGWGAKNCDQWHLVGRHLRTCSCSSFEARELVRGIARGIGAASAEV